MPSAAQRRASTISYYDERAEAYAAMTVGIDMADRITRFAALLPKGGLVLDAGCGAGRDLIGLEAAGLRPSGLDASRRLAAIARTNSGLPLVVGDLRNPPFAHASFDGIWAMASLLHVEADEIRNTLGALHDSLVRGGVLFASVKRGRGLGRDQEGRWFTLYDEASWTRRVKAAGFEIIEAVDEPLVVDGGFGAVTSGWISCLARRST